ncbi:MAG TPA: protocatechuate 3,4-dioxygenase subunit alpha [Burkholderiales bacterium]|jgi:protocatechuate 3,4-dioxygenase alpha subunit|nr:protocatechuate 3,4-dioxygenase subunit alpha [Burkholderiales bacterium]
MSLVPSGEMTLGPFFPREFAQGANDLSAGAKGEVIEVTGRITQLDGKPLDNLVVEIWQADSQGRLDAADFFGWGRAATDANGVYRFRTIKPGAIEGRAPHINFLLLYSGLMRHLQTVMFFEAAKDPVLDAVPANRREALIAKREGAVYRFDIRLRGDGETPFFDD